MNWKTLAGQCIHQNKNGITVQQNLMYRWLTFDSKAIQTLIHRQHPERSGLQYVQPLTLAALAMPGPSCLLGLGGAGVAHALMGKSLLDAVESNHEVIDIAATYFMTDQIKNLTIIHQDAFLFIQQTESRYQHLMVDLFNANTFPEHCNNTEFFEQCRQILVPGGILAVNLANTYEQWPIFTQILKQFPQSTVSIPVKGIANIIVLACNDNSVKPLLSMLENQPGINQLVWDAKWGYVAEYKQMGLS